MFVLKEFYVGAALTLPLFLFNFLSQSASLSFRKVFRAASLTSASDKDRLLKSSKNSLEENWDDKCAAAYYPPIMDINYNNEQGNDNNNNNIEIVNPSGSIQNASYQSDA